MNKHTQPINKRSLKGMRYFCVFIAVFLSNFPIVKGGQQELKIPSLRSAEVTTEGDSKAIELSSDQDLTEHLNSLQILSDAVYEDVTENAASSVGQEECRGWDSDEEIPALRVEEDTTSREDVELSMIGALEDAAELLPKWLQRIENYSRKKEKDSHFNNYAEETISSSKLAKDAKLIQEAMPGDKGPTTIFCVALRDIHGHIKKFACCNSAVMPPSCRNQAESLGYAVIKAEKSHAEGQFLQFLHKRAIINPGLYTHVVAMGCSRLHCPECDLVLRLVLGSNYKDISAAIGSVTEEIKQLEIQEKKESEAKDDNFTITRNASICCTIQSGKEAARENLSENFYMPDGLRALIEQKTKHKLKVVEHSRYDGATKKRLRSGGPAVPLP